MSWTELGRLASYWAARSKAFIGRDPFKEAFHKTLFGVFI